VVDTVINFPQKWLDSLLQARKDGGDRIESGDLAQWPMMSESFILSANLFYFATLIVLTMWMKNRKEKFQLLNFMRFYNLTCVLFAFAVVYLVIEDAYLYGPLKFYGNIGVSTAKTPRGARIQLAVWLYYIQKFWEFTDSFVFILRGKMNQLTFLHVYHHSSISFLAYSFLRYNNSGDEIWGMLFNTFVHVLMYSHYLLSTFKVNTWWKPYITQLQLIQFVAVLTQSALAMFAPANVGWPYYLRAWTMFYMLTMIFLFSKFYIKSYGAKKAKKEKKK
jgi:elongation of very long chain fatty acids protein 4